MTDIVLRPQDPRYTYKDITPPALPVAKLDLMMESVLDPEPVKKLGVYGLIVVGIKMVLILVWVFARDRLIKSQMEIAKQKYESGQTGDNQDEVDQDGERRP